MARKKLQVKGYRRTQRNIERAESVRDAVNSMNANDDLESNIGDLIANALHLAACEGLDPYEIHDRALNIYFEPEIGGRDNG